MLTWLLLSAAALCAPGVEVVTSDTGAYNIAVNGTAWLTGGNASFFSDGKWLSVSDGSLSVAVSDAQGEDKFGAYTGKSLVFTAGAFRVDALAKNYDGFAVFDVVYTSGVSNANGSDIDGISATYPSFNLVQPSGAPKLGVMAWKGVDLNVKLSGPLFGMWPAGLSTARDSGPHVLFDDAHTVMISAASNFMTHTFAVKGSSFAAGLLGSVTDIPAGYSISTILSGGAAGVGINNEVQAWGDRLRARYGKTWDTYNNDFTSTHLGYATDNGAYYYYNPGNGTYADAMLAVKKQAEVQNIPYRHALIDSWWYFKGEHNGVSNWTAAPGIFYENGGDADLVRLNQETGWPFIAHNRGWAKDTTYAVANGGRFAFSETQGNDTYVVPLEQEFWNELIGNATKWGLKTYEQDWLHNEWELTSVLHENATLARMWLMQMDSAAGDHDTTIQMCMNYPRHVLQSLEMPQVTQVRVSGDYAPINDTAPGNWNIGGSSVLAHALAVRCYKDNFWTTSPEPGSSRGSIINPDTPRAAAVATLSAGPVTPSDGAMFQNAPLIMKSTRADGVLLHPSRPCTYSDGFIRRMSTQSVEGPEGHVWSTFSTVGSARHDIVFVTLLNETFSVQPSFLNLNGVHEARGEAVAFTYDAVSGAGLVVAAFSDVSPMVLMPTKTANDFQIYYTSPVVRNGWALLGELDKWVPASEFRFVDASVDGDDLVATCMGSAGETVKVSFAKGGKVTTVSCTFTGDSMRVSSNGACSF